MIKEFPNKLTPTPIPDGYRIVKSGNKYGIVSFNGSLVVDYDFDSISYTESISCFEFRIGNRYGICRIEDLKSKSF